MKKYIYTFLLLICLCYTSNSMAYLENYEEYKGLKENILKIHNQEYLDYITNTLYRNTEEYQGAINNLVKVQTVFDVSEDDLEKEIEEQKLSIINKIKTKNDTRIGITEIDNIITKIQQPGKYIYMEVPGQIVSIKEGEYIYLYPHRILGNVDLISKIKQLFSKYRDDNENIVSNPNAFKDNLLELLDFYNVEYEVINGHFIYGDVKVGKNDNIKQTKKMPFFISKGFTTPYLEEEVELGKGVKQYIWTYITDEQIEYTFYVKNVPGTEVFGNIWGRDYYLGRLQTDNKLLESKFLGSNLDLYIYKIEKNNFEYIVLIICLVFGILLGILLSYNFVINYKNNFKKIPEEL